MKRKEKKKTEERAGDEKTASMQRGWGLDLSCAGGMDVDIVLGGY